MDKDGEDPIGAELNPVGLPLLTWVGAVESTGLLCPVFVRGFFGPRRPFVLVPLSLPGVAGSTRLKLDVEVCPYLRKCNFKLC